MTEASHSVDPGLCEKVIEPLFVGNLLCCP